MEEFNSGRVCFFLALSIFLAIFEIQIEGPNGWANNLPCWRAKPESWMQKVYSLFFSGKPLDGFHLSELVVLLLFFHYPFFCGVEWGFKEEAKTISSFMVLTICWDFLWFIFNPAYGWKKFKPEFIWWHKKWLWKFPLDYYLSISLSLLISFVAGYWESNAPLSYHFQEMLLLLFLVGFVGHFFTPPSDM